MTIEPGFGEKYPDFVFGINGNTSELTAIVSMKYKVKQA